MKIAIILPQLAKHGGAERVISYLANYWSNYGYQTILITFTKQNTICYKLNKNITVLSLIDKTTSMLSFVYCIVNLRKILLSYNFDIAIGVDIKANLILRLASFNIKSLVTIATEHRHPPLVPQNKFLLKIIRRIYSSMHAMVALTKESQAWFKQHTTFNHVVLIPNPLIYPLINQQPIVVPNTILNNNKKTLLAVGRLHHQKGFDLLITIFAKLVTKHENWQLVILGEGTQRQQLEQQRIDLNITNNVHLLGVVGNLADWCQAADVFVLSSRYEGLPCALMEAMAYGLPVISFDCKTGPSDIITHGIDGLLVESGNIDKLTQAIDNLISNPELCRMLTKQAPNVIKKFSIKKISSIWDTLFSELK